MLIPSWQAGIVRVCVTRQEYQDEMVKQMEIKGGSQLASCDEEMVSSGPHGRQGLPHTVSPWSTTRNGLMRKKRGRQ